MRRVQLFEIEDQPWCPDFVRNAMTGGLRAITEWSGFARNIAEHLAPRVVASGCTSVVDLCAGGGGPTVAVLKALRAQGVEARVTLTDLYPNLAAFRRIESETGGAIGHRETPVDATKVPDDLPGFRLVFNALHHLPPAVAQGVLRDAMERRQPVAAYEIASRDPLTVLSMAGAPLFMGLAVPFLRPFDLRWLPATWLLPIIPLASVWDGLVSCARVYDPDELAELVRPLEHPAWQWEIGAFRMRPVPWVATWIHGYPRQ